jgi:hypothetical protein
MHAARRSRGGWRARVASVAAAMLAVGQPAGAERLAPGESILVAAEAAPAVVAGVVTASRRVDARTWAATLRVQRTLVGTPRGTQPIVWQQPASREAPRFAADDRVLVALAELPSSSSWQSREGVEGAMLVAAGGQAFVREPSAAALDAATAYLGLAAAERMGPAGLKHLVELIAAGPSVLARAALRRLREAAAPPTPAAVERLAAVAADAGQPRDLRAAIVAYFGEHRVAGARPWLAAMARPGSDLEAEALDAIAVLDGGLDDETAERLLRASEPALRAVGARHAPAALVQRWLPELARGDADAGVRAAAVTALAGSGTVWGLDAAVAALADPAPEVRGAAAVAVARVGARALPHLQDEIRRDTAAAPGAIATLSLMGETGRRPLEEVARRHRSETLRRLAALALGKVDDHHH